MIDRRRVLAALPLVAGAGLPHRTRAAGTYRDAMLIDLSGTPLGRSDNDMPTLRALAARSTLFRRAFTVTGKVADERLAQRTGLYAHQLAGRGLIISPLIGKRAGVSNTLEERLRDRGHAFIHMSAQSASRAIATSLAELRDAKTATVIVLSIKAGDASAVGTLRRADIMLRNAIATCRTRNGQPPLIVIVGPATIGGTGDPGAARFDLLIAPPGQTHARTSDTLASSVDIAPTLLAWSGGTGADAGEPLPGRSLLSPAIGGSETDGEALFASSDIAPGARFEPQRSIRTATHRLVHRPPCHGGIGATDDSVALYDLVADPGCKTNIAQFGAHRAIVRQLHERLCRWRQETGDPLSRPTLI